MFNWLASVLIVYLLVNVLREPHSMNPETRAFPEQLAFRSCTTRLRRWASRSRPRSSTSRSCWRWRRPASVRLPHLPLAPRLCDPRRRREPDRRRLCRHLARPHHDHRHGDLRRAGGRTRGQRAHGLPAPPAPRIHRGYGFVGIAVALMGRAHPVGIVLASLLFGMLYQGGAELAFEQPAITRDMVVVIGGIIILFAGALDGLFRRLVARLDGPAAPGEGLTPWISASSSTSSIRPAAVDPAARRLPRRALVRALRRGGYRARRQDARSRPSRPAPRPTRSALPGSGSSAGIVASVAFALVHGFASISQRGNQIVSGVAINMLAAGLTAIVGNAWYGAGRAHAAARGRAALRRRALRPLGPGLSRAARRPAHLVRPRSHPLRAAPQGGRREPAAVDTAGISVTGLRYAAVVIAGVLCGLAGTYLSLGQSAGFLPNMTAGKGFIALAALIFAKWRAWPALGPASCSACSTPSPSGSRASRCRASARCRSRPSRRCPIS